MAYGLLSPNAHKKIFIVSLFQKYVLRRVTTSTCHAGTSCQTLCQQLLLIVVWTHTAMRERDSLSISIHTILMGKSTVPTWVHLDAEVYSNGEWGRGGSRVLSKAYAMSNTLIWILSYDPVVVVVWSGCCTLCSFTWLMRSYPISMKQWQWSSGRGSTTRAIEQQYWNVGAPNHPYDRTTVTSVVFWHWIWRWTSLFLDDM